MGKVERIKLAHDTEIDIGAPDEDSAYVTLGKLRSLLADSERCERLEGAIKTAIKFLHDGRSGGAIEGALLDALEVPDGE